MTNSPDLREEDIQLLIEATRGSSSTTTAVATPTAATFGSDATVTKVPEVREEPASITQTTVNDAPRIEKRPLEEGQDGQSEQPQKRRRSSLQGNETVGDVQMVDAPTQTPPAPEEQPQQQQEQQPEQPATQTQDIPATNPPMSVAETQTASAADVPPQPADVPPPPNEAPTASAAPEPASQPPGPIDVNSIPEGKDGMMLWLAKQVKAFGDQHGIGVESTPQDGESPERVLEREKVREENRERKKRWRESNQARNKDNDLRCRVTKRANKLFGTGTTDEKAAWITAEFNKRRAKREAKERSKRYDQNGNTIFSLNDNNIFHDSPAGKLLVNAFSGGEGAVESVREMLQGSVDLSGFTEALMAMAADETIMKMIADLLVTNGLEGLSALTGGVDILSQSMGVEAQEATVQEGVVMGEPEAPPTEHNEALEQLQQALALVGDVTMQNAEGEQPVQETAAPENAEQDVHMQEQATGFEEETEINPLEDASLLQDLDLSPEMIAALQAATAAMAKKGLDINDFAALQANLPETFTNIGLAVGREEPLAEDGVEEENPEELKVEETGEAPNHAADEQASAEVEVTGEQQAPQSDDIPEPNKTEQTHEVPDETHYAEDGIEAGQSNEAEKALDAEQAEEVEGEAHAPAFSIEDLANMDLSGIDPEQLQALLAAVGQTLGEATGEEVSEEAVEQPQEEHIEEPAPEPHQHAGSSPLVPELPAEIEHHTEAHEDGPAPTMDEILNSTADDEGTAADPTQNIAQAFLQALLQQVITSQQQQQQQQRATVAAEPADPPPPETTCTTSVFPVDPQRPMKQRHRYQPAPTPLHIPAPPPPAQPLPPKPQPPSTAFSLRPQNTMMPPIIQQMPRSAQVDDAPIPPEVAKLLRPPSFFPKATAPSFGTSIIREKPRFDHDPRVKAMGFPPMLAKLKKPPPPPPPVASSSSIVT